MNKFTFFLLLPLGLLVLPGITKASTTSCSWDYTLQKIVCQTTPDGGDLSRDIDLKMEALKSQYGLQEYYSCYPEWALNSSKFGDPYIMQSVYDQTKYCLERKAMFNLPNENPFTPPPAPPPSQPSCPFGSYYSNGQCLTPGQICQQNYGPNSYYQNTNATGTLVCGCLAGFEFNQSQTACVAVQRVETAQPPPSPPPVNLKNKPAEPQPQAEIKADEQVQGAQMSLVNEEKPGLFRRIINFIKSIFKFDF